MARAPFAVDFLSRCYVLLRRDFPVFDLPPSSFVCASVLDCFDMQPLRLKLKHEWAVLYRVLARFLLPEVQRSTLGSGQQSICAFLKPDVCAAIILFFLSSLNKSEVILFMLSQFLAKYLKYMLLTIID